MRKRITTVIFDIGQVLAGYGWEEYLGTITSDPKIYRTLEEAVFLNPVWVEHDKGLLSEEEEIQDFLKVVPAYEREIRAVYENLGECVQKRDYAVSWVKDLKSKGYRVYALSDWPKHIYDQRGDKLDFLDYMDGYCLSYREHFVKPDEQAFRNLLEKYAIRPEEAVFIDDRPVNVEVARRLGLTGIVFESRKQAVEELRALGVQ